MIGQARQWWAASRRRRRRVVWLVALVVVAGSVGALVVWVRDTGTSVETPVRAGKPLYPREPATVKLGPVALHAAQLTTYRFLSTAVLRQHVEDSYALAAPSLRKGYTRARWAKGEIPVVPYPVDLHTVRYRVDYSYASGGPDGLPLLGMAVSMRPTAGSDQPSVVYGVELEAAGVGAHRHWMISQWTPRGTLGGAPQTAPSNAVPYRPPTSGSLSTLWLLIPGVLLSGFILIPAAIGVRSWIRNRRIARSY
jgi:hypothetical protein